MLYVSRGSAAQLQPRRAQAAGPFEVDASYRLDMGRCALRTRWYERTATHHGSREPATARGVKTRMGQVTGTSIAIHNRNCARHPQSKVGPRPRFTSGAEGRAHQP